VKTSVEQKAKWRAPIAFAFLFLFLFLIILSVGRNFVPGLGKFKEMIAASETQYLAAKVTQAENETNVAVDKLSNDFKPPTLSKDVNSRSRTDLEALDSELKTAEARATAFMPQYITLLETEHDKVENYAQSSRADRDSVNRVLDDIDKRHAKIAAFISTMLLARTEYYRAYENYLGVLISDFGANKVVSGEFIFVLAVPARYHRLVASRGSCDTSIR
jgi:hypothetical protein